MPGRGFGFYRADNSKQTAITARNSQPGAIVWAEDFISSGLSAVFLLLVNLDQRFWIFSLIALLPFILRSLRASPAQSLRLGLMLGFSFLVTLRIEALTAGPSGELPALSAGICLFGALGWLLAGSRLRWGFNPFLTACLWLLLEATIIRLGLSSGIFGQARVSTPFLHGIAALLGLLGLSLTVVVISALLAYFIDRQFPACASARRSTPARRSWPAPESLRLTSLTAYLLPPGRAPPSST